jgi:hypothetical protein
MQQGVLVKRIRFVTRSAGLPKHFTASRNCDYVSTLTDLAAVNPRKNDDPNATPS